MSTPASRRDLTFIAGFIVLMVAINVVLVLAGRAAWGGLWNWQTFGTMVAAAITVALFTQLYSDNPLFKTAEHIFVGTSVAYGLVVAWYNYWVGDILKELASSAPGQQLGVWSILIPGFLGLMVYSRLTRRWGWISRWPFAFLIGFGVGYAIPTQIAGNLLKQLDPMMIDLLHDASGAFAPNWNGWIILIGVLSTLTYFFFSVEHKKGLGAVSRVGIWFLMVSFGASFGFTVMGRLSLLIGRIDFLFREWIPLIR
jgi:hypothetical protein